METTEVQTTVGITAAATATIGGKINDDFFPIVSSVDRYQISCVRSRTTSFSAIHVPGIINIEKFAKFFLVSDVIYIFSFYIYLYYIFQNRFLSTNCKILDSFTEYYGPNLYKLTLNYFIKNYCR